MNFNRLSVLFLVFILTTTVTVAQENGISTKEKKDQKRVERAQKKAQKIEDGKVLISPLIIPGYSPELKFTLSAGGIVSWTNNKLNKQLPRSNMVVSASFSATGAIVLGLRPTTYWFNDNVRIDGIINYKNMPDNYWGVGYHNGWEVPKSDSTTYFQRKWLLIKGNAIRRIKNDFFAGITFDANYTKGYDASFGVANDENYKSFNELPFNAGIGPKITYDSRDVPVNAWKGMFINAEALFYEPLLKGDNVYQVYSFDYRQYKSIGKKPGRVIAWQLLSRLSFGNVPYGEMSQLGTPFNLRGYVWGRYRDKSMVFALTEYRHKLYKPSGSPRKSGFVTWLGTGTVFDLEKNASYNTKAKLLPNFGIGYRLELQPRLNLRIDVGIGSRTKGFYVNMNEAF